MATELAKSIADQHKTACNTLASFSTNPEIKTLAAALSDSNQWLDDGYSDMRGVLQRLTQLESALATANEEIKKLNRRLQ